MKVMLALAVLVAVAVAENNYSTENDDLYEDFDELRKFSGCFLGKNKCGKLAADFKKKLPVFLKEACFKCTYAQKHIFKWFLNGIKVELPQDFAEFKEKYDSAGKFYTAFEKAIESA